MHAVKVGQFEGPLDLMLELIEGRKLSINDVSLAEVTDQYLEYLKKLEHFPLEEVAFFVVVASTLMLIKSRSLMPSMELTPEEEKSIGELEERLKIYQRIRELSLHVKNIFGEKCLFARDGFKGVEIGFIEPTKTNIIILHQTLKRLLENLPIKECLPEVEVKKVISLEEKILELAERIKNQMETSFHEFSTSKNGGKDGKRIEIIVSFLAMLEMIKQGMIMVRQGGLFEKITICKKNYE